MNSVTIRLFSFVAMCLLFGTPTVVTAAGTVILIDGQNNHDWKSTTPILVQALTRDGRFDVAVATSPPRGGDMNTFRPKFSEYDAVLSNYNGDLWSEETCRALENFVSMGGALVVVHAANNSFPEWKEWNTLIGLGGWGGRNEKSGPLVRWKDGKMVQDNSPGAGGHHGSMHPFAVVVRDQTHPIVEGLPTTWMHANDELYDRLRGPAKNMQVLATAYSDPATGGSGEHEPMIITVSYGQGRVFHTPMGHDVGAMKCPGFQEILRRGTEWAIEGTVMKRPLPIDFPGPVARK